MNLKSKIFGFAAASVFALSMTTGVMAADGSTTANVDLVPRNNNVCSMTVTNGTVVFTNRVWTGTDWGNPADSRSVNGSVTTPSNVLNCDIQGKSAGLNNGDGAGTIGLTVQSVPMDSDYETVLENLTTGGWTVGVVLDAAGTDDEPGSYQGVIDFQVLNHGQ